ncbi:MAG TPA: bifunctional diaminohydroxyphosphoribosylaminopyrimidine deaminase/5-amino-6-(5-phosphoribosylamino)uracil reductase RibD [Burkholderiaceae bacterium]|nr:bifunctional diaminohydroxyphosphoribosylaminopyrimidine deaminase/5-amino-6-(5-phosphoribosylamino)uracil reductase RibD [Burkholderiaceae bacterium]
MSAVPPFVCTEPDAATEQALAGLDRLAELAVGLSDPNPRVACRLLLADGRVFEGHTQAAGGPHAEVMALRAARAADADLKGATALVTLEPCSHHGRTPPCCDALIAAGVSRVVVALPDPNPLVGGQGLARLRAAGVQVDVLPPTHPLAVASAELNIGFISRMVRGRPWVRLKMAASLDGTTALANGASQWITGPDARANGHGWRKRAGAVLTGIGTIEADNPRLDVRLVPTQRQPVRVVVDSHLALRPDAHLFQTPDPVWVYTTATVNSANASTATDASDEAADQAATEVAQRWQRLTAAGASVITAPTSGPARKTDLPALLADLAKREINELHVEAGHKLAGSFLRDGLVDELLLYMAPRLLGPGAGLANIGPFESLQQSLDWHYTDVRQVGTDLRILARRVGGWNPVSACPA